jgi:hypothetical protein
MPYLGDQTASTAEYTVTFLYIQAFFGQAYSDRYFLELYLQSSRTDLLLVLRVPIDLLLKEVPRNYPFYRTSSSY